MTQNGQADKIDIVLTWVDGSDPAWRAEKERYFPSEHTEVERFRDWDNLQYIFRGIEKYMPWVNQIHLVTWGHLPKWLNTAHPKLHIVNHKDYIPEQYLPTFNSNAIEMNFHRIEGLAEQFIVFNDDMFVIQKTNPEDFFLHGLPRDMAVLSPPPCFRDVMCNIELNNFIIINDHFSVKDIERNKKKWYSAKYGKFLVRTMLFQKFSTILGIFEPHIPVSVQKHTLENLWEKEPEVLDATCRNRQRKINEVNIWLCRHWQIMSGLFEPRRWDFGSYMAAGQDDQAIVHMLEHPGKCKLLCINDTSHVVDFVQTKTTINQALQKHFPEKSAFESEG